MFLRLILLFILGYLVYQILRKIVKYYLFPQDKENVLGKSAKHKKSYNKDNVEDADYKEID